ncbi:MAG: hypothetical protein NZ603_03450 [Acidimicrobiales bacterium]|jgi:hypothetical protein|nr:hypothetical protein [Acidimicrobiales bacterium]|tara:strand:- start:939 stop:1145 length:207 start_codon:yes stop_codon:yes gene_type:complete
MVEERITRQDLEAELRATVGEADGSIGDRRSSWILAAAVTATVVVAVAYLVGRRAGRRRSTVVEVRRF